MSKMSKAIAALGIVAGLGVAALPLSSYAEQVGPLYGNGDDDATATLTVKAEIEESIALTITGAVSEVDEDKAVVDLETLQLDGPVQAKTINVSISTNLESGAILKMHTTAEGGAMTSEDTEDTIPGGVPDVGVSFWGYKTSGSYAAVPESGAAATLLTLSGDDLDQNVDVTFGASADATQSAGNYSADVVFTATAN